jgi:hypothetical protein
MQESFGAVPYRWTALTLTFAALRALTARLSTALSMLKHRLDGDCTLAGVGIIRAGTPQSRSAFVPIMVPEFDANTRTTSVIVYEFAEAR